MVAKLRQTEETKATCNHGFQTQARMYIRVMSQISGMTRVCLSEISACLEKSGASEDDSGSDFIK